MLPRECFQGSPSEGGIEGAIQRTLALVGTMSVKVSLLNET